MKKLNTIICSLFLLPLTAQAFYTVQDTGDLLKENEQQFATELQLITTGDTGVNFIGRYDRGLDQETNLRFEAGVGTTDFAAGGYIKWVPFPDYESQPAIGFTFGAHLARYEDEMEIAGRFIPFASKQFETDMGRVTPYVALPIAFSNYNDDNTNPFSLALGSRYRHQDFDTCDFTAELGFDLSDSFNYLAVGAIFPAF